VNHGFKPSALHGDLDQPARMAALEAFRKATPAPDRLRRRRARPRYPGSQPRLQFRRAAPSDDYVHRIGRTGRAGRSGTAITIVAPIDQKARRSDRKVDRSDHSLGRRAGPLRRD
jgi:superfamily II DNA/RNA helicase